MNITCCKDIWTNGSYRSHKCNNTAKFEVNGSNYCGMHNPNKSPTKVQIDAELNHKLKRAKWKLESSAPELLSCLEWITAYIEASPVELSEAHSWAVISRAAIAKATGN